MRWRQDVLAAAALSIAGIASGSQIGMNFVRGPGGDVVNVANTAPNSLATTDSAGAPGYVQTNWNNLGFMGTNINVLDSSGAASGVVVSWVRAMRGASRAEATRSTRQPARMPI